MYASAMTAVKHTQLRSDVRGTRGSREDIVIINEWVPLGLASQGFDQANQCITEGTEAFNDCRDELAAHTLCKRVICLDFDYMYRTFRRASLSAEAARPP